jgi:hypothetical protein
MSEIRAIYHEFADSYRMAIVDTLFQEQGWNPVLMTSNHLDLIQKKVAKDYASCILQNSLSLRRGEFDYKKIGSMVPIDATIIESLSKYELSFLSNQQDTTEWNFSYRERRRFYYDFLNYWNTVIQNLKPQIIVLFTWPHTPTCYSLYLLCKHHYKIPVIFLDTVPLLSGGHHLIGTSLEELHLPIMNVYTSAEMLTPSESVEKYLSDIRSPEVKSPDHILTTYKQSIRNSRGFRLKSLIHIFIRMLKNGGKSLDAGLAWKKNKKPFGSNESRLTEWDHYWFVERTRRRNKALLGTYEPLCITPDFEKKYLYFAASYQPEATTSPNAGVYEDFFLVLDILSSIIPDDWVIYYKENPTTFNASPWAKGSLRRDKSYFERLNAYSNIQLVSSSTATFTLIDEAMAVATVSGTVAWEAALRGKPALAFGNAWYMGCKSILHISSREDAKIALEKILAGYVPEQGELDRYAAAIEKVAVKGMIHRKFHDNIKNCEDPGHEMKRIAEAVAQVYDKLS